MPFLPSLISYVYGVVGDHQGLQHVSEEKDIDASKAVVTVGFRFAQLHVNLCDKLGAHHANLINNEIAPLFPFFRLFLTDLLGPVFIAILLRRDCEGAVDGSAIDIVCSRTRRRCYCQLFPTINACKPSSDSVVVEFAVVTWIWERGSNMGSRLDLLSIRFV
jgi:hypothetical protein